jgi:hypothetical protein
MNIQMSLAKKMKVILRTVTRASNMTLSVSSRLSRLPSYSKLPVSRGRDASDVVIRLGVRELKYSLWQWARSDKYCVAEECKNCDLGG